MTLKMQAKRKSAVVAVVALIVSFSLVGSVGVSSGASPSLTVTNVPPASGATNVPLNTTITLTFNSNPTQGPGYANITLSSGTFTSAITGNTLTITPTSPLSYGTYVLLTIPANALHTVNGTHMAGTYVMALTTSSSQTDRL